MGIPRHLRRLRGGLEGRWRRPSPTACRRQRRRTCGWALPAPTLPSNARISDHSYCSNSPRGEELGSCRCQTRSTTTTPPQLQSRTLRFLPDPRHWTQGSPVLLAPQPIGTVVRAPVWGSREPRARPPGRWGSGHLRLPRAGGSLGLHREPLQPSLRPGATPTPHTRPICSRAALTTRIAPPPCGDRIPGDRWAEGSHHAADRIKEEGNLETGNPHPRLGQAPEEAAETGGYLTPGTGGGGKILPPPRAPTTGIGPPPAMPREKRAFRGKQGASPGTAGPGNNGRVPEPPCAPGFLQVGYDYFNSPATGVGLPAENAGDRKEFTVPGINSTTPAPSRNRRGDTRRSRGKASKGSSAYFSAALRAT